MSTATVLTAQKYDRRYSTPPPLKKQACSNGTNLFDDRLNTRTARTRKAGRRARAQERDGVCVCVCVLCRLTNVRGAHVCNVTQPTGKASPFIGGQQQHRLAQNNALLWARRNKRHHVALDAAFLGLFPPSISFGLSGLLVPSVKISSRACTASALRGSWGRRRGGGPNA